LSNISIQGLKTIAVEVIFPAGGGGGELQARGITKEKLEETASVIAVAPH